MGIKGLVRLSVQKKSVIFLSSISEIYYSLLVGLEEKSWANSNKTTFSS